MLFATRVARSIGPVLRRDAARFTTAVVFLRVRFPAPFFAAALRMAFVGPPRRLAADFPPAPPVLRDEADPPLFRADVPPLRAALLRDDEDDDAPLDLRDEAPPDLRDEAPPLRDEPPPDDEVLRVDDPPLFRADALPDFRVDPPPDFRADEPLRDEEEDEPLREEPPDREDPERLLDPERLPPDDRDDDPDRDDRLEPDELLPLEREELREDFFVVAMHRS